jgi:hypothetical protein
MVIKTNSRGIVTYGCSQGCGNYLYEEVTAPDAIPNILIGILQKLPAPSNAFVPIADTV